MDRGDADRRLGKLGVREIEGIRREKGGCNEKNNHHITDCICGNVISWR